MASTWVWGVSTQLSGHYKNSSYVNVVTSRAMPFMKMITLTTKRKAYPQHSNIQLTSYNS